MPGFRLGVGLGLGPGFMPGFKNAGWHAVRLLGRLSGKIVWGYADDAKKNRNRLCNGSSAGDADEETKGAKEAKFTVSLSFDYF